MSIYFVILFICFIAFYATKREYKNLIFGFLIFLLFLIGAFRGLDVGTDLHGSYYEKYYHISLNPASWEYGSEMEPGFCFYMAFLKKQIINSYEFFYATSFFIFMSGMIFVIRRYSTNILLCLFFFVLFLHYTWAFNAIRQAIAISLVAFTFPLLEDLKKYRIILYELLIIYLTFRWHRTCIVFVILPLFYLPNVKTWFFNHRMLIMIIIACSYAFVFLSSFLYKYISNVVDYVSFLGSRYEGYVNSSVDAEKTISVYTALLQTAFALYVSYVIPKKCLGNIWYILFVIGVFVSNFLGAFSALFIRVAANYLFFDMLLFSFLWYRVPFKIQNQFRFLVIIYGLIFFSNAMLKNFNEVVPYYNWIFE